MMRSRKLIAALLSVALAVSFLSGCGQKKAKEGKINTAYFYGEAVWPSRIPSTWPVPEDEYPHPSETSVTFNGITYTGTYKESEYYYYGPRPVLHLYIGDGFSFTISDEDGECYSFVLVSPKTDVCTLDSIRGRELADAFADNYISVDEYKVTEEVNPSNHAHTYHYTREVEGIRTADQCSISLTCDGNLKSFSRWQLGAFENVKSVDIDEEKAKAAIEQRCREFYTDEERDFSGYEVRTTELLLVKTEANQCALHFTVAPRFRYKNSEHDTSDWLQQMLVIVDYEKYNWFKP